MPANKRILLKLITLLLIMGNAMSVFATTNLFYEGARPLALGGAFSAIADDENAKWWNPAGMVNLRSWQFDIRVMPQISKDSVTVARELPLADIQKVQQKVDDGEDVLSIPETQDILDYFADLDEVISLQDAVTLGLTVPRIGARDNWAFGISTYARAEVDELYIQQNGLTSDNIPDWVKLTGYEIIYNIKADEVINLSGAYCFNDLSQPENTKSSSIGVNVKQLTRYRLTDKDSPKTVEDLLNKDIDLPENPNDVPHASTLAFDIGAMCRPTEWISFALVTQDIGAVLNYGDGKTSMEHIPTNVKFGSAFSPIKYFNKGPMYVEGQPPLNDYDVLLSCEADDIGGGVRKNRPYMADKLHAGLELRYSFYRNLFGIALRGGSNQGFPSYGAGLNILWILEANYAYYGAEKDEYHVFDLGLSF